MCANIRLFAIFSSLSAAPVSNCLPSDTIDNFMSGQCSCPAGPAQVSYFTVPFVALNTFASANPPRIGLTLGGCTTSPSLSGLQNNTCIASEGVYCFQNASSGWMVTMPYCSTGYSMQLGKSDPVCVNATSAASCSGSEWLTLTNSTLTASAGSVGSGSLNYWMTCNNRSNASFMYYGPSPPCNAGYTFKGGPSNMSCQACLNPSYSSFGSKSCNICAPGYYGVSVASGQTATSSSCTACSPGQYSPAGSVSSSACMTCPMWSKRSSDNSTCTCSYSRALFNASEGCPGPPASAASSIGITAVVAMAVIIFIMSY